MSLEIMPLLAVAALTGIVHTLLGPDHYLPFIALSKAQSWSIKRTAWVTALCGLGHILSSVVIGYFILGMRLSLSSLHIIDSFRSDLAAWALMAIGCAYFIWSIKKLYKEKGDVKDFSAVKKFNPILWSLFIVFVVGPCEPLFFLMTYPALVHNSLATALMVGVFGVATIATMLTAVLGASFGLSFVHRGPAMRFAPAIGGLAIAFCGVGIKFLGL